MSDTAQSAQSAPFLEKVMVKGNFNDIYDARDISEVVFRTMRDLIGNETVDEVASSLDKVDNSVAEETDKSLERDVADLWRDTNPLVRFLSRLRPPLDFDDDTFLYRIKQEGGLPASIDVETAVTAVFSATKDELSAETVQEVARCLPGRVQQMWVSA